MTIPWRRGAFPSSPGSPLIFWKLGVARFLVAKIKEVQPNRASLRIRRANEVLRPLAVSREILRRALRDEDVAGIAAIHHALGDVDASAGDIGLLV